jgi:hypothetical protein
MPVTLPTQNAPFYSQLIDLDGTTYSIVLRWNTREEAWYLDIDEQDGTGIVRGQKILPLVNLSSRWADSRMPPGILFVDAVNSDARPGRDSLFDGDVALVYITEDEVENGFAV